MSKSACELVSFICPNHDKVDHKGFSKEHPVLLVTGEMCLLPRIYITDSNSEPRAYGVKIPVNCCTECWDSMMYPEYFISIAANPKYKDKLSLESEYILNNNLPKAKREIFCNNANRAVVHKGDSLNKTNDIVCRGLFLIQPLEYLSYVDNRVYQDTGKPMNAYTFELEIDCCLDCLEIGWEQIKSLRMNKLIERFAKPDSPDIRNNPDFAATFNYFKALSQ